MKKLNVLLCSLLLSSSASAADGIPYHHLALFLGAGIEEKKDHDEDTFAVGLEYEYRFSNRWGIGGAYETLGEDSIRNHVLVLPISLHPGKGWRLFFGPGYEWHDDSQADKSHDSSGQAGEHKHKDKFLLRLGAGYEFHVGGHWSLAPELIVDALENGDTTWLTGVAIGYHF